MRIAVANVQVPFVRGGAEIHADTLVEQLRMRGFEAELVTVPFKWYPAEQLIDGIVASRMLDLSEANGVRIDRLIGLKFPIYLAPHPDKILWILHQHRTAYDLWDHPQHGDLIRQPQGQAVRAAVHHADNRFIPEARAVFANSRNVAARLAHYNGILAQPLYHPPKDADAFHAGPAEDYFFFPSRIMPLKRQHIVLEAMALCREPVRVVFSGSAEDPDYAASLRALCRSGGLGERALFRGFISDSDKRALYAHSLGVIYPPVDEDYGYVTLEAMLSHKPIITTIDAGGPLEFVEHGRTGLVCAPAPDELAAAMDMLWRDRGHAKALGGHARDLYDALAISWDTVVEALTA